MKKLTKDKLMIYLNKNCNDCKKAPPHVSVCFNTRGYCKYFPYDMNPNGNHENLFVPKENEPEE